MLFRRKKKRNPDEVLQAQDRGEWATELFIPIEDDEAEAFREGPTDEMAREIERRIRVARYLGYIESRPGAKNGEFRVIDQQWWNKCRWIGREHEGWSPYIAVDVSDEEGMPSEEEVRVRTDKAIDLGLIQEMPGNPRWMRALDDDWWIKAGRVLGRPETQAAQETA